MIVMAKLSRLFNTDSSESHYTDSWQRQRFTGDEQVGIFREINKPSESKYTAYLNLVQTASNNRKSTENKNYTKYP